MRIHLESNIWLLLITFRRLARKLRLPGDKPELLLFCLLIPVVLASYYLSSHIPDWIIYIFGSYLFANIHIVGSAYTIILLSQSVNSFQALTLGQNVINTSIIRLGPRVSILLLQLIVSLPLLVHLTALAHHDQSYFWALTYTLFALTSGFMTGSIITLTMQKLFVVTNKTSIDIHAACSPLIVIVYVGLIYELPESWFLRSSNLTTGFFVLGTTVFVSISLLVIASLNNKSKLRTDRYSAIRKSLHKPILFAIIMRRLVRLSDAMAKIVATLFALLCISFVALKLLSLDSEAIILPMVVMGSRVQWTILRQLPPTTGMSFLCGIDIAKYFFVSSMFGFSLTITTLILCSLVLLPFATLDILGKIIILSLLSSSALVISNFVFILWRAQMGEVAALLTAAFVCSAAGQAAIASSASDVQMYFWIATISTIALICYFSFIRLLPPTYLRRLHDRISWQ